MAAPDLTREEVLAILGVLEATGARADVEAAVAQLVDAALRAAEKLPVTGEARTALAEIAVFVVQRDH